MLLNSSNSTFDIAETTTDNMFEVFRFFFFGKYTSYEYEYTFYLNNEEVKADECYSNIFGRNYCKLNGVTYNNVEYTKILVNEYEKTDSFMPIFSFAILSLFLVGYIFKLFSSFRRSF